MLRPRCQAENHGRTLQRLTPFALAGVLVLAAVSLGVAQQVPQPAVRLGDWLEVGNDVLMQIIAVTDIRYRTVENYDFEHRIRDRVPGRTPVSDSALLGDSDLSWARLDLGVELRYQQNLRLYLLGRQVQVLDGDLTDNRSKSSTPGGTDIFGRGVTTENTGLYISRAWIDYTFPATPLRLRVGYDLWRQDQAGLVGDNDPRLALFGQFGDVDVMAAAVIQSESQRLGLENDNDFIYYTFSGGYSVKPHRFQVDVTYFRERFLGADRQDVGSRAGLGFSGQKTDSVLLMGSWSGSFGPFRGLVQGNVITGTARGGTAGLPPGVRVGRHYDILGFAAVGYGEVTLANDRVKPFVGVVYGSADGNPFDHKLHGFMTLPQQEITLLPATSFFGPLAGSPALSVRDYACPGRANGLPNGFAAGVKAVPPRGAIGTAVFSGSGPGNGFAECGHSAFNPFNDRLGSLMHLGLFSTYSNPGALVIPVGVRVFPVQGHEITGWYIYRAMVDTTLLEVAFAPQLAGRRIHKTQYHALGGFWQWTLSPYFDIRLTGNMAIAGAGYRDLARLANCNTAGPNGVGVPFRACAGNDVALSAAVRFRAHFFGL